MLGKAFWPGRCVWETQGFLFREVKTKRDRSKKRLITKLIFENHTLGKAPKTVIYFGPYIWMIIPFRLVEIAIAKIWAYVSV